MGELYTYDWHIEGEDAVFTVDESLYGVAPMADKPCLIYISCESKDDRAEALSPRERRHADRLLVKCEKAEGLVYAGSIECGAQVQHYFYGPSEASLRPVAEAAGKERLCFATAGCVNEPDWTSYVKLLYPDAAKRETELNREHIARLSRRGDNPDAVRRVRFHVFFMAEPMLIRFEEEARIAGFAIGDREFAPEYELAYGVMLYKLSTLDKREMDGNTTRVIRLAERCGGMLRDWDCQLMPKNHAF